MRKRVKKTAAVVLAASMTVANYGMPVMQGAAQIVTEAAEADEQGFVIEDGVLEKYEGTETESVDIPDSVTVIGVEAFEDHEEITQIHIPDSVTEIGRCAFAGCTNLEQLELPSGLVKIGQGVLEKCMKVTRINIPLSLTEAESGIMNQENGPFYKSAIQTIEFEVGRTEIPASLFAGCAMTHIDIPDTVTTIGRQAFYGCLGLTEVDIPDSVTEINDIAFASCTNLQTVTLSDSLRELGQQVFEDDRKITDIHIPASLVKAKTGIINGELGPFMNTGLQNVTFDENTTSIAECLFAGCVSLEAIDIPDTVETIGKKAFFGCCAIQELKLPWGLKEIENSAFEQCTGLTSITIPDNVTKLGEDAFARCTSLKEVTFPEVLEMISERAFEGDAALEEIILPVNVTEIRGGTFKNCTSLAKLEAPGLRVIKNGAFTNTGFTQLNIPDGVQEIDYNAFSECQKMTKVEIPGSVTNMEDGCFAKCSTLEEVQFDGGMEKIPKECFSDCGRLKTVVFPYGVKKLEQNLFRNCTALTDVTVPKTVEELEDNIFSYPKNITMHCVAGSAAETYAKNHNIKIALLDVHAESAALSDTKLTMYNGQEKKLVLNVTPADFTDDVKWTTADESVATVEQDGTVTAETAGDAIITATVGNITVSCEIHVMSIYENDTIRTDTLIKKDETKDASAGDDTYCSLLFEGDTLPADNNLIVRTVLYGCREYMDMYAQMASYIETKGDYNPDAFFLYQTSVCKQADGSEVQLAAEATVTFRVPGAIQSDKVVVARIEETPDGQGFTEIIHGTVQMDGNTTITIKTDKMGTFAVLEELVQPDSDKGDVDDDGAITLKDAQLTLKAALKLLQFDETEIAAADVNGDGNVTLKDAQKILRYALKLDTSWDD